MFLLKIKPEAEHVFLVVSMNDVLRGTEIYETAV